MLRAIFTCLLLSASPAWALCAGEDLRAGLSPDDRAEIDQSIDGTAFPEGNHWLATREGETIHVIGTMHLDDPRLEPIADRLRPVIERAGTLMVEMTPEDEALLQSHITRNPDLVFITEGPTLPDRMSEDDWQALAQAAQDRGIPPFMAAKFQPWYLSLTLAVPPCAKALLNGQPQGLDHRLMDMAEAADIPMLSLEPFDTIFSIFSDTSMDEQIEMMRTGLLPAEDMEDMFTTLLASYFDEATAEGWHVNRILAYRAPGLSRAQVDEVFAQMETELLVNRNRAWIAGILDAASSGQPVVVAAGAAHLFGHKGVLALLEAEGFALARQPF